MTKPVSILLVEDDEDDITFFELALRKQSGTYQLTTLTEGDSVLPYLEAAPQPPDLLFLDLNLPRLHGREVLQQLNASPSHTQLPVFILTTSSAQEERAFCLANGARQFITKPTSLGELSTLIGEVLQSVEFK